MSPRGGGVKRAPIQLGEPEEPIVGPTEGPAVPVLDVVPVGPDPSVVSGGITTPFRDEGGGTGSATPGGGGCAGGGEGVVAQAATAAASKGAASCRHNRLAIDGTT